MNEFNYSLKSYFNDFYRIHSRKYAFNCNNKIEHEYWRDNLKDKLIKLLGLDKMNTANSEVHVIEEVKIDFYIRKKLILETQPNVYMPFFVILPESSNNIPVIAVHGHGSDGKNALAGITNELTKESALKFNYDYAVKLAERGYIVFVPDLCGSGERREALQQGDNNILKTSCNDINNAAISMGITLSGLITFDLMRLTDYIYDCGFCDSHIACCGFSGGALSALWLSALDERIQFTGVSGYYHGFKDTILENNLCGCNFVPNLWNYIDVCDLGALIAPRYLAVESGDSDNLNGKRGLANVYEQLETTKKAYDIYKSHNIKHSVCKGPHKWFGTLYQYLDDWSAQL